MCSILRGEEKIWEEEAFKDENLCPKGIYRSVRQMRQGSKQIWCEWLCEKQRESLLPAGGVYGWEGRGWRQFYGFELCEKDRDDFDTKEQGGGNVSYARERSEEKSGFSRFLTWWFEALTVGQII